VAAGRLPEHDGEPGMKGGKESRYLASHRAHDYTHLLFEWKKLASEAGVHHEIFATIEGSPLLVIDNQCDSGGGGLYVSAGIHGDEPAAAWGLLEWARQRLKRFAEGRLVIFPCLNPHGLEWNTRVDEKGRDLNRLFDMVRPPPVLRAWHRWMEAAAVKVEVSVCLHEDYDSQGAYCYEIYRRGGPVFGRRLLDAGGRVIPIDGRSSVEGRKADKGWIKRASLPKMEGAPEAFALYRKYSRSTITYETPSEFSLYRRVCAHARFLRQLENLLAEAGRRSK